MSSWLAILAFAAAALWGSSGFGHARYSFVYGSIIWLAAFAGYQFIGDWAIAIGLLFLGLRWVHLRARANEERQILGATTSDIELMKKSFEYENPGVPYPPPADRDEMIARVAEFKTRKRLR